MKHFITLTLLAASLLASDAARTPLDAQEHDKLSNAYINYLAARVMLLEALGASKAGTVDIQRAEQATTAFNATLADVQKKHGADGCMWDFGPKVWRCEK